MGVTLRSRPEHASDGLPLVQMKDLGADGLVSLANLDRVTGIELKDTHTLLPGDLLFRSRGAAFAAGLIDDAPFEIAFAAPLMRIRVDTSKALPAYVQWLINSPISRSYLETATAGSGTQMLSKSALLQLPVPLPDLPTQESIASLIRLQKQEQRLMEQIVLKRKQQLNAQILRIFQEV